MWTRKSGIDAQWRCSRKVGASATCARRSVAAASGIAKWRRRVEEEGPGALRGRSRAPKRQARRTSPVVERAVLQARDRLERRIRGREFSGIGADAVVWELDLAHVHPLPARRTIERILQRSGRSAPGRPRERTRAPATYPGWWPACQATSMRPTASARGTCARRAGRSLLQLPHRRRRGRRCGHRPAPGQRAPRASAASCWRPGRAWGCRGRGSWTTSGRSRGSRRAARPPFTKPLRLALFLGVEVRFIPAASQAGTPTSRASNDLWQERVLRRFDARACRACERSPGASSAGSWRRDRAPSSARPSTARASRPSSSPRSMVRCRGSGRASRSTPLATNAAGCLPLTRGRNSWVRRADEQAACGSRASICESAASRTSTSLGRSRPDGARSSSATKGAWWPASTSGLTSEWYKAPTRRLRNDVSAV